MRSKLLSKDTGFSRRNRCVVHPGGDQGNTIPVSNPTGLIILIPCVICFKPEQVPRCPLFLKQRTERLLEATRESEHWCLRGCRCSISIGTTPSKTYEDYG